MMELEDSHLDLWRAEAAACEPTGWEAWIAQVEALLGRSADGDYREDGFSLDGFFELWKAGKTPQEAFAAVPLPGHVGAEQ